MQVWIYTLASVTLISLISLVGVFTLSLNTQRLNKMIIYLVSFAVGGLFGDALIHLLPEAFEKLGINVYTSLFVVAGILLFFVLEKFLRWQHCHHPTTEKHYHPVVAINLVGDAVHNLIDGMIIAASFSASIPVGIATTVAVILHEIPQEIGDFGILVHGGVPVRKALLMNLASALTAFLGAIIVLVIGPHFTGFIDYLLPITAGGFLYIAGSDLIPALHEHEKHDVKASVSIGQFLSILLGVGLMACLVFLE